MNKSIHKIYNFCLCFTLRSRVHEGFSCFGTVFPGLGDNYESNEVLTVFHTQKICHSVWKTLRTTLWCFVFLQSRGEGLKSKNNFVQQFSLLFKPLWQVYKMVFGMKKNIKQKNLVPKCVSIEFLICYTFDQI